MGAGVVGGGGGGRNRSRRGRRAPPMSEINVTPFVDVMLVLLIIFMVAAPLLTVGVPLRLPETAANALPQEDQPPLTVNLGSDGVIYLQETPIDYDALAARLPAIRAERTDGKVYLRADAALDYGLVAQVMGALDAAGFKSIALVTDSRGPVRPAAAPASDPSAGAETAPAPETGPETGGNN